MDVSEEPAASIFRVKQSDPEDESTTLFGNVGNYLAVSTT